jgi:pilus assembly protein Flp/PilA
MGKLLLFLKDNSGATAIEYGLSGAGISVAIIVAMQATGTAVATLVAASLVVIGSPAFWSKGHWNGHNVPPGVYDR